MFDGPHEQGGANSVCNFAHGIRCLVHAVTARVPVAPATRKRHIDIEGRVFVVSGVRACTCTRTRTCAWVCTTQQLHESTSKIAKLRDSRTAASSTRMRALCIQMLRIVRGVVPATLPVIALVCRLLVLLLARMAVPSGFFILNFLQVVLVVGVL